MLDFCQEWCERSRIQINVAVTNTMSFFPDSTSAHFQERINHCFPTPRRSTLPKVTCFKYWGVPLDETLSTTPLKDDILDKFRKSRGKLPNTFTSLLSFFPGLSTLGQPCTSPSTRLQLCRSCVLVQATQNLRYITPPSHVQEIHLVFPQQIPSKGYGVL